mmetsp:Transcript_4336/g.8481  ORF Transcript_4336/g.8481 Transcript_4336/m.8481 type:complete len:232 (+) Transcript_4336:137-832(+)
MIRSILLLLLLLASISNLCHTLSFQTTPTCRDGSQIRSETTCHSATLEDLATASSRGSSRRQVLSWGVSSLSGLVLVHSKEANAATAAAGGGADLSSLREQVEEARKQLDPVTDLIKAEKWDSIRAILIKPPLSDCWGKSSASRPLLQRYAEAIGDVPEGDELAALEAREDAVTHLRFLDMAAYNNVFNPIKTEGETGATKGLIKSYYEDPMNEFKASVAAMDELVRLGSI